MHGPMKVKYKTFVHLINLFTSHLCIIYLETLVIIAIVLEKDCDKYCYKNYKQQDRQCIYKRNIEARSCNHCCSGKAMSITYCKCVFVALVIQHAKCMRYVMLYLTVQFFYIFPHYFINGTIFQNKLMNTKCVFRSFSTFVRKVSHSKRK
jgi:hypothetical protein